MRDRLLCGALFVISLVLLPLAGCGNPSGLDSIQISPTTQSLTTGQTVQFSVTGTYGNSKHATTQEITSGLTWVSSNSSVATVDSNGLATAVGAGSANITATAQAFNGPTSSTAALTVTASGGSGSVSGSIASIAITPGTQAIAGAGNSVQFIAIGTTSSGSTVNLTSQVSWISSATSVATIGAKTGLATSVAAGTTSITALYTDSTSGSTVIGTATLTVTAAASGAYTSLSLIPTTQSLSASGQTAQFIALGTTGAGVVEDVTDSALITWSSSAPSIATVSSTGLATGSSVGTTTVTAKLTNPDNSVVTADASVAVSLTSAPEPILSLSIIPSSITVGNLQATGQFLAIGTFSTAPYVRDLTNSSMLTWLSSTPNVFPVNNNTGGGPTATAGIVSAWGTGGATIIAEAKTSDGTVQTATATFSCPLVLPNPNGNPPTPGSCYPGSEAQALLSTLTVYNEGLNTTSWQITAPSATGTANVLHCGPGWTLNGGAGGSICSASYPAGTTVTITATGGNFGGWSYNCTPTAAITAAGPNSCTVTLNSDDTVGAIFN